MAEKGYAGRKPLTVNRQHGTESASEPDPHPRTRGIRIPIRIEARRSGSDLERARHRPPGLPGERTLLPRREPGGSSGICNCPLVLCAKTQPSEAGVFWRGRFAGS